MKEAWLNRTHVGDCRELMRQMIADRVSVQCVITSPPYWGLRDYGMKGQFGLERTWQRHVARARNTFRLVREVLRPDGVLWMNYGDSYAGAPGGWQGKNGDRASRTFTARIALEKKGRVIRKGKQSSQSDIANAPHRRPHLDLKPKDLVGMPWRVALALQSDGWWLRSDIIWHKSNPMPESTKDRPTKAHEYIFLLARSHKYYWNQEGAREAVTGNAHSRGNGVNPKSRDPVSGWARGSEGKHSAVEHAKQNAEGRTKFRSRQNASFSGAVVGLVDTRNFRTVWNIPTQAFDGAHFATFPKELVARCILASTRPGDTVFDPFMGSGTVAEVATSLGRKFIGCELNPEYAAMFSTHRSQQEGMAL